MVLPDCNYPFSDSVSVRSRNCWRVLRRDIIWVAALLSSLLALERLFRDDLQDGSLEQLMLLPLPLPAAVLAKVMAHWMVTGLPLLILSPLVAMLLGMDVYGWQVMALTLLLGTPTLGFLGAPGVALTVGLKRGGVLLSILVLPLTIPLLIFATAAMDAASMHLPVDGYLVNFRRVAGRHRDY